MRENPEIGIQIPEILLPRAGVDLTRWAVIACDQFTSEPEYWQAVADVTHGVPSTAHLILPEVFLGTAEAEARTHSTQATMQAYLKQNLFIAHDGMILVERQSNGKTRHGIMLALDLEQYDYNKGSQTLIRATEGTILNRLPPRIRIRQGAPLELPHILVLIDDPKRTVIEPLVDNIQNLPLLYDFELMLGSGHLAGYSLKNAHIEKQVVSALQKLANPQSFASKYNINTDLGVLLFAMGDGNHSFATAKAIWEQLKPSVGLHHPARYALVEVENVHDQGLDFEPIHRVLFNVNEELTTALARHFGSAVTITPCSSSEQMFARVDGQAAPQQAVGVIAPDQVALIQFTRPTSNLPVGTLQSFLDGWLKAHPAMTIDYVHGKEVLTRLGTQPGNLGFYLPAMPKSDLFKTVIMDGALPRKTFSMGEAKDKRFYMECRKIVE